MQYPSLLVPTETENIQLLSGQVIQVPKAKPSFPLWDGEKVPDDYNGKAVLKYDGRPGFAELVVLRILQKEGWDGVWVDTFSNAYRTEYWPKNSLKLPDIRQGLLDQINAQNITTKQCWDVFAWKDDLYLFAELKRTKKDGIRDTQRGWLTASLQYGLPITSFLIVQWSVA